MDSGHHARQTGVCLDGPGESAKVRFHTLATAGDHGRAEQRRTGSGRGLADRAIRVIKRAAGGVAEVRSSVAIELQVDEAGGEPDVRPAHIGRGIRWRDGGYPAVAEREAD